AGHCGYRGGRGCGAVKWRRWPPGSRLRPMASQAEVRRIALALPGAVEVMGRFAFAVPDNKGKLKQFAWVWMARVAPRKARVPQPNVVGIRTASIAPPEFLIKAAPTKFFTEPHYDGYPAVLVRLAEVTSAELRPLIREAWRTRAPEAV